MDVNVITDLASDDLPDEHKTCIYRVVQEALHNCSRHSHATRSAFASISKAPPLSLSIQDDGCGFDVKQVKGLGLLGIEERVARLGGQCKVQSERGTRNHARHRIAVGHRSARHALGAHESPSECRFAFC